jgi:3',5'-cyclic AMP phosphodiesterase CpdA
LSWPAGQVRSFYPIRAAAGSVAALTVLAQLSDPHVDVGPGDAGSAEALAAAVAAVRRLDPAPDAVLVSGDLTNRSDARSYERVRELLAPLSMPVHVLPGNHDDREALRTWFTDDPVAGAHGAPFQYTLRCGDVRLVVCDTTVPGRDDGRLDAGSLAWLEGELAAEPAVPTIVAMHHAPLLTGIGAMDAIGLPEADRSGLADLLRRSPQVRRVVAGHVHRACFGLLGPCGVFACPSTHLQVRWDPAGPRITLDPAPPSYGLHTVLAGGEVVTLVQPVGSGAGASGRPARA